MKYKILVIVMLISVLLACDKADQREVVQPENISPQPVSLDETGLLKDNDVSTSIKQRQLDTSITPDMVKNLSFDATSGDGSEVFSDKPLNLSPGGNTQISVTPKLILKESEKLNQKYLDNFDGAAVQVEVKFD